MSTGYFSGDSQVLLASGKYKNISQIEKGDLVFNEKDQAVEVLNVHHIDKVNMMELRYENWYTPFYCTSDLRVLVSKEDEDSRWVATKDLEKGMKLQLHYVNMVGKEFNIPLTTPEKVLVLKPTYEFGLLIGLYAGYGMVDDGKVQFSFGPNNDLVDQVSDLLKHHFDAVPCVEKDECCYRIIESSSHVVDFFSEFGDKVNRIVPAKYFACDKEYVQGLYDGLVEYDPEKDINRYIPVTSDMAEVFLMVCSLLKKTFENDTPRLSTMRVYPLFVKNDRQDREYREDRQDHLTGKVTSVEETVELEGWNLEVSSPRNSIVVNNLDVEGVVPGHILKTLDSKDKEKETYDDDKDKEKETYDDDKDNSAVKKRRIVKKRIRVKKK